MTTPDIPESPSFDQDGTERARNDYGEKYLDITDSLAELQTAFIDHLVDHAKANPQESTIAFSGMNFIDDKIGRDFSRLSWLNRGDEILISGNVAVIIDGQHGERHFMHLGEDVVLNGYVMTPHILMTPLRDTFPDDLAPFEVVTGGVEQWSLALELEHTIVALPGDSPKIEDLSKHFQIYLPLAYHDIQVEKVVTDTPV